MAHEYTSCKLSRFTGLPCNLRFVLPRQSVVMQAFGTHHLLDGMETSLARKNQDPEQRKPLWEMPILLHKINPTGHQTL